MKKIIITLLATFLFSNNSIAEVDLAYLHNIDKLVAEKKYQQALEAHQYFFEESKKSSGMGGVRVSFALASWTQLGSVYPPALIALSKISSDHKTSILSGKGSFYIFQEYQAINSYIGKNNETLETFLEADRKFPTQAKDYYLSVKELLISAGKFDIIKKYLNDPIYEYELIRNERERALSQLRQKVAGYNVESINSEFQVKVKALLEVTRKIGLTEEAKEIKRRSDSYINGNLLRKYY
uniref:hypothetical protein n=1 Tax=Cellvibrio fontiphilus TaxID=1815559 RepID=UPI002B4BF9CE|nr:hypothetical protein [Cellvibrio fontiphilus]